ncbi:uncharacterized protein CXQ87_004749 [Candidozyma duobushaemuli]|uniref:ATP-dependent RNA helicase n=2 Tax=Candidozyma TaxID=3303203 RepID=A0ABX8IAE1_9ASCO|nr:uncharacterized protein CXQ87_004749 [[Candida] duobushaemulonis]PVH16458.1 hypothetical protein CXQ87_004749 [[Candida] duobushaemulonis]QWU90225.1 hypothetical protein CA3LBN_004586 [[Candida] haemuloni]
MLSLHRSLCASLRSPFIAPATRALSVSMGRFKKYEMINKTYSAPELLEYNDKDITLEDLEKFPAFHKKIAHSFKKLGYSSLTPVQSKSIIPTLLEEKGVVCRAKTGTGKTMAFVIPTLQTALDYHFESKEGMGKIHTLIIAPTRDLAIQIKDEYFKILKQDRSWSKINVKLCIGGRKDSIRYAPGVLVATPGRLEAELRNPRVAALFSDLKYRVYDEADRLLETGFEESLMNIDRMLRDARHKALNRSTKMKSVLFSATVDERVEDFARATMGDEYRYINCVPENEPEAHENIHQTLVKTHNSYESMVAAFSDIFRNFSSKPDFKAIMFLPTKYGTDFAYDILRQAKRFGLIEKKNASLLRLHGQMTQGQRDKATAEFRSCKSGLLVATDVAARGMDFKNVTDVIQLCPSSEVADYVHKVGRTARAGSKGNATLYLSQAEVPYANALSKKYGITFANEVRYETMDEDAPAFEKIALEKEDVDEYTRAHLAYLSGVVAKYRLRLDDVIKSAHHLSKGLLQDENAKLSITATTFKQFRLRDPYEETFDVPGGIPHSQFNDRRGGKGFKNNNKSYNRFDNRSKHRGYDGNSFSNRNRYGDRDSDSIFDKRRNDRHSKRTFNSRY